MSIGALVARKQCLTLFSITKCNEGGRKGLFAARLPQVLAWAYTTVSDEQREGRQKIVCCRTAMNVEPSNHPPLRWHQLRLSFMLVLITLVSVAMSLVPPWNTPNRERGHFTPHESPPEQALDRALDVIVRSGSASTARPINLHDELLCTRRWLPQ
jgi:hypothetical protein